MLILRSISFQQNPKNTLSLLYCSYRMSVIKNLPQLQKLDNTPVQPDEVGEAMRRGVELVHPHDRSGPAQDDGYYGSYGNVQVKS